VREEGDGLILAAGVPTEWLTAGAKLAFGPAPTAFGEISLTVEADDPAEQVKISWQGKWHGAPPGIDVRLPGFSRRSVTADQHAITLIREKSA
jgi:hypothetical protein